MMKEKIKVIILFLFTAFIFPSCTNELPAEASSPSTINYQTQHVIVIVMDGPRYSETWGDTTHQHIPHMANNMAPKGSINTHFYNNGPTLTNQGHTAIVTGNYQIMDNTGKELPNTPSLFQYWLKANNEDPLKTWIITSKDKLEVLSNTTHPEWENKFRPSVNCGINGLGSGYRNDSITYQKAIAILSLYHPKLTLINFREPDFSAHIPDSVNYIQGIKDVAEYIYSIWRFIESDSVYKGTTSLFVTNDHGRHLDSVSSGFTNHGDTCEGCRHINFYAFGPDFKSNFISDTPREQIDISATIAQLMHFDMPSSKGNVMKELFK